MVSATMFDRRLLLVFAHHQLRRTKDLEDLLNCNGTMLQSGSVTVFREVG